MRDGVSDCFGDKEERDRFFNALINRAKTTPIPSDTEVCRGESPFGEELPYPYCVNQKWEVEEGLESTLDSKISQAWDNWRVKARKEIGSSEDMYAGEDRVKEFERDFLFQDCVKAFKKMSDEVSKLGKVI